MNIRIWWAKFRLRFVDEKFSVVKTFIWETPLKSRGDKVGKFYIHCLESNKGKRKIEVDTSFSDVENVMYVIKQWHVYHEVVYPWLNYRFCPEIPVYREDIDEDWGITPINLDSLIKK